MAKTVCSRCDGTKVDPELKDCRCDCCDEDGMEGEDDDEMSAFPSTPAASSPLPKAKKRNPVKRRHR
jgi:hypothetical protein